MSLVKEIVSFCTIRDLGSLTQCSQGGYFHCNQDTCWASFPVKERVRKKYPEGTPTKKLVAATQYREIVRRRCNRKFPLNYEWTEDKRTKFRKSLSSAKRQRGIYQRECAHLETQPERFRVRLQHYTRALKSTVVFSTRWNNCLQLVHKNAEALTRVSQRMRNAKYWLDHYTTKCRRCKHKIQQINEAERLHDVFVTPYLKYYWLYLQ